MQFILQKSEKPSQNGNKQETKLGEQGNIEKIAEGRKSATLTSENVGIVKGIPQKTPEQKTNPEISSAKVEAAKERTANFGPFQADNSGSENLLDLYNQRLNNGNNSNFSNASSSPVTSIGVSGSLKPPAYRNPPAPKPSTQNQKISDLSNGNFSPIFAPNDNNLMQNVQYRDLVQLIKYQREKINTQQNDLTKVSAWP